MPEPKAGTPKRPPPRQLGGRKGVTKSVKLISRTRTPTSIFKRIIETTGGVFVGDISQTQINQIKEKNIKIQEENQKIAEDQGFNSVADLIKARQEQRRQERILKPKIEDRVKRNTKKIDGVNESITKLIDRKLQERLTNLSKKDLKINEELSFIEQKTAKGSANRKNAVSLLINNLPFFNKVVISKRQIKDLVNKSPDPIKFAENTFTGQSILPQILVRHYQANNLAQLGALESARRGQGKKVIKDIIATHKEQKEVKREAIIQALKDPQTYLFALLGTPALTKLNKVTVVKVSKPITAPKPNVLYVNIKNGLVKVLEKGKLKTLGKATQPKKLTTMQLRKQVTALERTRIKDRITSKIELTKGKQFKASNKVSRAKRKVIKRKLIEDEVIVKKKTRTKLRKIKRKEIVTKLKNIKKVKKQAIKETRQKKAKRTLSKEQRKALKKEQLKPQPKPKRISLKKQRKEKRKAILRRLRIVKKLREEELKVTITKKPQPKQRKKPSSKSLRKRKRKFIRDKLKEELELNKLQKERMDAKKSKEAGFKNREEQRKFIEIINKIKKVQKQDITKAKKTRIIKLLESSLKKIETRISRRRIKKVSTKGIKTKEAGLIKNLAKIQRKRVAFVNTLIKKRTKQPKAKRTLSKEQRKELKIRIKKERTILNKEKDFLRKEIQRAKDGETKTKLRITLKQDKLQTQRLNQLVKSKKGSLQRLEPLVEFKTIKVKRRVPKVRGRGRKNQLLGRSKRLIERRKGKVGKVNKKPSIKPKTPSKLIIIPISKALDKSSIIDKINQSAKALDKSSIIDKINQSAKALDKPIEKQARDQAIKNIQGLTNISKQLTIQETDQAIKSVQDTIQTSKEIQNIKARQVTKPKPKPKPKPTKPKPRPKLKPPIEKVIIPPFIPELPKKNSKRKVRKTYNVFVRENNKLLKANNKQLTKNRGKNLGVYITDNSSSASFKLKRTGKKTAKEVKLTSSIKKYRKGKRLKKFTIEKRKHRIDTIGELKGITAKGLIARRNKNFRRAKTRVKKRKGQPSKKRKRRSKAIFEF